MLLSVIARRHEFVYEIKTSNLSLFESHQISFEFQQISLFDIEVKLRCSTCEVLCDHTSTDSCVCVCFHLQVEKELKSICNDILDVLDKHLILAATTGESKVFYYKMYVSDKCCTGSL